MKRTIAIIGAGSVGSNAAIFLAKLGFDVSLFDYQSDILEGSPMVSFINHGDGFEYYKNGHQATGKFCIDGSMVKGLIYPLNKFRTNIVSEENPIRFLVSEQSKKNRDTPLTQFYNNAELMKKHFSLQYESVKKIKHWSDSEAKSVFLRSPETFYKILRTDEFEDLTNIVGGCSGSSFGINMPHYFAYLKAAMRHVGVTLNASSQVECIEKQGSKYLVHVGRKFVKTDMVIVAANHNIPIIAANRKNFELVDKMQGTYYLNSMTFLELPETSDDEKIKALKHINFTLQGDNGCMYACIVPPTKKDKGIAAIYFPSELGSQEDNFIYRSSSSTFKWKIPSWQGLINNDGNNKEEGAQRTFEQACIFYPFLKDYAIIKNTKYRPVFNINSKDSEMGKDRRVREINGNPLMLSEDGCVTMWTSPKWTNAELVALIATDYVCKHTGIKSIPKLENGGFGPTRLDIATFSENFNFQGLHMDIEEALQYSRKQGISEKVINPNY